jgi:hypothetical protein
MHMHMHMHISCHVQHGNMDMDPYDQLTTELPLHKTGSEQRTPSTTLASAALNR